LQPVFVLKRNVFFLPTAPSNDFQYHGAWGEVELHNPERQAKAVSPLDKICSGAQGNPIRKKHGTALSTFLNQDPF
jgi:hypothetical protein